MKAKFKLVIQGWTGWVPQQPEPEESTIELEANQKFAFPEKYWSGDIRLKSIFPDHIILQTNHLAPQKEAPKVVNPREENLRSLGISTTASLGSRPTTDVNKHDAVGINLRADYSNLETSLAVGETANFTTQTMDQGTSYRLTLLEITP